VTRLMMGMPITGAVVDPRTPEMIEAYSTISTRSTDPSAIFQLMGGSASRSRETRTTSSTLAGATTKPSS
jgi:hypothetical protein